MTEKKVTPEKRMELARYIREENLGNRLKLRQREHILYGKESPMPLYEKGLLNGDESLPGYGNTENGEGIPGNGAFRPPFCGFSALRHEGQQDSVIQHGRRLRHDRGGQLPSVRRRRKCCDGGACRFIPVRNRISYYV